MNINILPDLSLAAAPFTTVLTNALKVATTSNSDNIIQYSAPARVEPITLIDSALGQYEDLFKILGTLNNLFAAYYMQATSSMINVSAMRLLRDIDSLRPNRDMNAAIYDFVEQTAQQHHGDNKTLNQRAEGRILEVVGESLSLPVPDNQNHLVRVVVTESADGKPVMRHATKEEQAQFEKASKAAAANMAKQEYDQKMKELNAAGKVGSSSTTMTGDLLDAPNLAVGRIFEVTADYGQGKVTIQVLVSLSTLLSSSANLVDIYSTGGELRSFKERWHGWRSGQLRFVEDIIFCQDIIENHKRTAVKDNTGVYLLNRERDTSNRVTALLTGKASIGTASGISIFSAPTMKKLEAAVGGKMDNFATREKVFKRTFTMVLVVVDTEWDMVTVYHRGISKVTSMPVAEFAKSKTKGGSDVSDIVKLFLSGTAPTL